VSLSQLLSANASLLEAHASPSLVSGQRRPRPLHLSDAHNHEQAYPRVTAPSFSGLFWSSFLPIFLSVLSVFTRIRKVDEFASMIRELGPQPRFVNFFEAICRCDHKLACSPCGCSAVLAG